VIKQVLTEAFTGSVVYILFGIPKYIHFISTVSPRQIKS